MFDIIPNNQYYGMDGLIRDMLAQNMPVAKYALKEFWLDIGRMDDFNEAQELYKEHFTEKTQG